MSNPLAKLADFSQSVWFDNVRRGWIAPEGIDRMIREDGLRGVTSNPAIFEKAIVSGAEYDAQIRELSARDDLDVKGIYEALAIRDIQNVADHLEPVYRSTNGVDGYVSLEVSPYLARDTEGTMREARRLWKAVGRPNLMIKVPGTPEGVPAVRRLLAEGINVNVTLLFGIGAYEAVARAHMEALEEIAGRGGDLSRVASVASFFVSRIDTLVDRLLQGHIDRFKSGAGNAPLRSLMGRAAIANARIAYAGYRERIASPRWEALARRGARPQRLLWASTGTKDPAYSDVLYVEELIGPDTVTTIPEATWSAYRDHGRLRSSLEEGTDQARSTIEKLAEIGIDMDEVAAQLLEDGIFLFVDAFDKLLSGVRWKRKAMRSSPAEPMRSGDLSESAVEAASRGIAEWQARGGTTQLWKRDPSLWTGRRENRWLGWLGALDSARETVIELASFAADLRKDGFTHILLLGMGGSSLAPEVLRKLFGRLDGSPELLILDSVDPAQIESFSSRIEVGRTIFIVSSKSGTTLESRILMEHFWSRAVAALGAAEAGRHFIAITDPGSKLEATARANGFRKLFFGVATIGGRFSALSPFGLVPAAVMGIDIDRLLARAEEMLESCGPGVPDDRNPGVLLGATLGRLALDGRDKVTIVTSHELTGLGAWLEQLLAESTGKQGRAILPIEDESLAPAILYQADRVFVDLRLGTDPPAGEDPALAALENAGHPVISLTLRDREDLGAEFLRWEVAAAVAGSIMGIDPFDQPDVEAAKVAARELTAEFEKTGAFPDETPAFSQGSIDLYVDPGIAMSSAPDLASWMRAHLGRIAPGDYFAILAFLEMNGRTWRMLQAMRHAVRDRRRIATSLGFGPRYLHSTGQAHKGGPNTGLFLMVTCDDALDLPVPGEGITFSAVKAAQARGDLAVLASRGRRIIRAHIHGDLGAGLETLDSAVRAALG